MSSVNHQLIQVLTGHGWIQRSRPVPWSFWVENWSQGDFRSEFPIANLKDMQSPEIESRFSLEGSPRYPDATEVIFHLEKHGPSKRQSNKPGRWDYNAVDAWNECCLQRILNSCRIGYCRNCPSSGWWYTMVYLPLWKIWVRQLVLWHSQYIIYMGKSSPKIPWFQINQQPVMFGYE